MSEQDPATLMQEAQAALDIGDKQRAVEIYKQVVEEDPENIAAWESIAQLVEDIDEKRLALTTILQLDPDNAYAKEALIETEKTETEVMAQEELVPGITRGEARRIGIGLAAYTVAVCAVTFIIIQLIQAPRIAEQQRIDREAANQRATEQAIIANNTQVALELTEEAIAATQTAAATITPPTRTPDLPPTWTPSPEPTVAQLRLQPPPPFNVPGRIIAAGGRTPRSREYLLLRAYSVSGEGEFTVLNNDLVQNPAANLSGTRLIYETLNPQDIAYLKEINGQNPEGEGRAVNDLFSGLTILDPREPYLAAQGGSLVFIGTAQETGQATVYFTDLTGGTTMQISSDAASYLSAAVSPDSTKIVAVREDPNAGVDLVLFDRSDTEAGMTQTALTSDGNARQEASPAFSSDGSQIIFSVTENNNADVYSLRLPTVPQEVTSPVPVLTGNANEMMPMYSPDGAYIAYASDEPGVLNIFIFEIGSGNFYQLTAEDAPVYPGVWVQ